MTPPTIVVHGGAGAMRGMTPERDRRYRDGLRLAAEAGRRALERGEDALSAAIEAVVTMEDGGVFNAGLGACLTSAGTVEMDAAVMRGSDRGIGAVASMAGLANPVRAARAVMERTPHCLLVGSGAAEFAVAQGFGLRVDFPPAHRVAEFALKKAELVARAADKPLAQALASLGGVLGEQEDREGQGEAREVDPGRPGGLADDRDDPHADPVGDRHDTVGAVACDAAGGVAVAVSTGGIWLKMPGRVGDSPLPGSGFWAVDGEGAAVATGTGECLMKILISAEVTGGIRCHGDAMRACADAVALLTAQFGTDIGGVIAVGPAGQVGFALNTHGMGRGVWQAGMERPGVAVDPDEPWDVPLPPGD